MLKTIKLEDSVGTKLAHDITEIRPGEFKGACRNSGKIIYISLTWKQMKSMKTKQQPSWPKLWPEKV